MSILFVDLVGFTAVSDKADPEDTRDLLQLYHSRVKEQAERFGGTVEKFIGDAVMAVFGAPLAHTDDADRAVRAGLSALEAVQDLNKERPGLDLTARASVNTGEAVVTTGSSHASGEALAMGDVVNTASRLQAFAPAGRLIVGEETYRSSRESIRYEAMGSVEAKGKRDPFNVWLAVEPVAAADRPAGASPLVGRDRQLAVLQSVWDAATQDNRPQMVTVLGPPGIGKSRLSREFAALVAKGGGRSITGRCLPYKTHDVYGAFAEQVKELARIFDQDDPNASRAKLADAVTGLFPEAERQDIIRYLSLMLGLGLDPPVDRQALLLFAARRFIEQLGLEQPTLFVFEDVHWADAGQLDLISYVAAHARDTPVVLLALARPELVDDRPAWGTGVHANTTISLDPVSNSEAATMVGSLVGEQLPPHALGRIVEAAGGNPLFLEELTAGLIEGADLGSELPTTVRAAIAARVDALPPEQRSALLAASVVGKSFWQGAVRALSRVAGTDQALDALEARDLVRRAPTSRLRGDVEFTFKHMLIRDVCYATLPRAERKSAHESVARYMEQVTGEKDRELAWLLAHHWEEAGDAQRAFDYLMLAAERAQEAMAASETLDMLKKAQDVATDDNTRTHVELLRALARVKFEDFDQAAIDLEALIPRLSEDDRLEAMLGLARCTHWSEQTNRTLEVAQQALALAEKLGARESIGPAMARLSQAHAMRGEEGDMDRAIQLGERALELWVPGTRLDDMAEHEHLLGDQHYWTAGYGRALDLSRAARDQAVDPSSMEALLRGGGMEGLLLTVGGRYEEALASFDRVISLGRELGRPVRVLLNYSSMAYRDLHDLDEARRRSEEALTQASRSSTFHMPWMNAVVDLMETDLLAGEAGAADARWRELWDQVLATPAWERWLLGSKMAAFKAEIALQSKSPDEAAGWATRAIQMSAVVRRAKYEAVAHAILGRALQAMGRHQEGVRELRAAVQQADDVGSPPSRWRLRADLGAVLAAGGDDQGADSALRESASIIRGVEAALAPRRAARFLNVPRVAAILKAVG
ncbi:MAG TPA: adenylate/guanylate cyclase domain-containing protein [Candidatus Dormibacteraeota bacterium]|nr:adenylate/guanylate cyclase domain-containing protein [Candidatus Dormibacteraeota bacterium]